MLIRLFLDLNVIYILNYELTQGFQKINTNKVRTTFFETLE
jgi:hypothetical protein